MKITVYIGTELAFTVETKVVHEESFPDLLRQAANVQLAKWLAETPQKDHVIKITEQT